MKKSLIKEIKATKDVSVSIVEIGGRYWIHKKEDRFSSINEKAFQNTLKQLKLPYLEILEDASLPEDEILLEYVPKSKTLHDIKDPIYYEHWGRVLSKLHSQTSEKSSILTDKGIETVESKEVIDKEILYAKNKLINFSDFSNNEISKILDTLDKGFRNINMNYSVIHGDMHQANALVRNKEIVLFDKSPMQWSFSPLMDLSIVLINFPNGTLIQTEESVNASDKELWQAFIKGYGDVDMKELELFCLLQASRRVNNTFEKHNPEIIRKLVF